MSVASRLIRSLIGVEWGDINSAATELTVTYDDCWITRSGIATALKSIGVSCKIFAVPTPAKPPSIADRSESRVAQKIRYHKEGYRRNALRSPHLVCCWC
jgi:hypothetical protein